ncbi:hypothetical protein [Mycobacterium sp. 141]|uniref:hypothetical protein n=1 Tax=Mycobacterium sp. 141 TaxID=1120797 RepID=UPI00039BF166|nr:hypothetical protein [Mycobacterium sp. 141]
MATIARMAGVSRTFLYENPDARRAIEGARAEDRTTVKHHTTELSVQQRAADSMWREKALNAAQKARGGRQLPDTPKLRPG